MRFIGSIRDTIPANAVHGHRHHAFKHVQQPPACFVFEHRQQPRIHEIQLPPQSGSLPCLGPENHTGCELAVMLLKVVLNPVRWERAQKSRLGRSLHPSVPAFVARDKEKRNARFPARQNIHSGA